jgi:hypothetical protein
MAARKKTAKNVGGGSSGVDVRAFTVVLEGINAKFNVFGEALQGIQATMDERFGRVDQRFGLVDRELALMRGEMRGGFQRVDCELSLVQTAVLENNREIKELRVAIEDLDARKADRAELPSQLEG